MKTTNTVFMSIGQVYTPEQLRFVNMINEYLEGKGFTPLTLDKTLWDPHDPLSAIYSLMKSCLGVIVIAFPRLKNFSVVEFPDSTREQRLDTRLAPTIWNQIEAALAYTIHLPLLSMVDDSLYNEALLNPKHPAYNAVTFNMMACQNELPLDLKKSLMKFTDSLISNK